MPSLPPPTIFASEPVLVTIPDVPLCSTGIEYQLASGPITFTEEDLADAVASQDDPAIVPPRLKFGHTDQRFTGDGEPAWGKVLNLRLSADRQTVIGDYTGVPKGLADIMPSAFPSRSIEGNREVETVTGKKWRMVITAVAQLGVVWPGVSTLDDLVAMYSQSAGEWQTALAAAAKEGDPVAKVAAVAVTASVNAEDVRRQYYENLTGEQMWWWIRAMYLEPNELIVDDDEGQLYRVGFSVNGETVEFDDPQEVKIVYQDVKKKAAASAGAATDKRALALVASAGKQAVVFANRAEARPDTTPEGGNAMGIDIAALRKRTGLTAEQLPDDASEEQINAALSAETPETPPNGDPPEDEPEGTPEGTPEEEQEPVSASTAKVPKGMRLIDEETLASLQAGAKAGVEVKSKMDTDHRDGKITAAIKVGKFPPSRREHYEAMWKADPKGTEELIEAMAEGMVPSEMREIGTGPSEGSQDVSAYPSEWLPEVANRGATPTVVTEA